MILIGGVGQRNFLNQLLRMPLQAVQKKKILHLCAPQDVAIRTMIDDVFTETVQKLR